VEEKKEEPADGKTSGDPFAVADTAKPGTGVGTPPVEKTEKAGKTEPAPGAGRTTPAVKKESLPKGYEDPFDLGPTFGNEKAAAARAARTESARSSKAGKTEKAAAEPFGAAAAGTVAGSGAGREYTVAQGDSLATVARKYYGSSAGWAVIYEANRDRMSSPHRMVVGTKLRIPDNGGAAAPAEKAGAEPAAKAEAAPKAEAKAETPKAAGQRSYTVQPGDTLRSIARKFYGSSAKWQLILDANKTKVSGPQGLRVGTDLVIPVAEGAAAPAKGAEKAPAKTPKEPAGGAEGVF
jgi:nucleoid-associated protein YgaU